LVIGVTRINFLISWMITDKGTMIIRTFYSFVGFQQKKEYLSKNSDTFYTLRDIKAVLSFNSVAIK
jgi:hypothetical protein